MTLARNSVAPLDLWIETCWSDFKIGVREIFWKNCIGKLFGKISVGKIAWKNWC
jgi:hypothetical protein